MEIRYLLGVIRAHLSFVIIMTLVAGATGLLATYVLREDYEASTLILIRPQQQRNYSATAKVKSTLDYPVSFNIPPESVSQTYGTIMTSPAVAKRVVELLKLDQPAPHEDAPIYVRTYRAVRDYARLTVANVWDFVRYGRVEPRDPYWNAVDNVVKGLKASPVEDTYLFKLTATWNHPQVSAAIADTAARVFIEYTLAARRNEESAAVEATDRRLQEVQAQLDQARERLRVFEAQKQSSAPTKRLELKLDALTQAESLREETARKLASTDARISSLQGQLESEPVEVQASRTLARNDFLSELRTQLASDERKLAEREQTMTPEHPEVKALRARIEATNKRIAEEQEMVRLRDDSARNTVRDGLRKELLEDQTARQSLMATQRELEQTVTDYKGGIEQLVDRRAVREQMALDVSVLEDEYKFVNREHSEALLAVTQELSEIRALAPAIVPVYPRGPLKILYVGLGLCSGFILALGLILAADYAEPRIRSSEDIVRLVGVPVIEAWHGDTRKLKSGLILADGRSSSGEVWRVLAAAMDEGERRDDA